MTRKIKEVSMAAGWVAVYSALLTFASIACMAVMLKHVSTDWEWSQILNALRKNPAASIPTCEMVFIYMAGIALILRLWHPFRDHKFVLNMIIASVFFGAVSLGDSGDPLRIFLAGMGITFVFAAWPTMRRVIDAWRTR